MIHPTKITLLLVFIFLSACATVSPDRGGVVFEEPVRLGHEIGTLICENEVAQIRIGYPTANLSDCKILGDERFSVLLKAENTPINNSAWYGFYVKPKQAKTLRVVLNYEGGTHRYAPKISFDGKNWQQLDEQYVIKHDDKKIELLLRLDNGAFFVSAQEIFSSAAHQAWLKKTAKKPFLRLSGVGASKSGKSIQKLETFKPGKPYVMFVGRQHPPEVTGALAMVPFLETLYGDSSLAKNFRENFNILSVPLMNPDGVDAGYWRHNFGGKDLNRDWGPFNEPETQAIKNELDRLDANGDRIVFFADFHSTWRNLLYTQTDDEVTSPPMFAHHWVTAVQQRLDAEQYPFTREPRPVSDRAISKNYIYKRYGISAITFEVGDNTDRKAIADAAVIFAEEMMKLLLDDQEN